MPTGFKIVLAIALTVVLLTGAAVGATVGTIYRAGTVSVSVAPSDGGGVDVAIPAGLANVVMWAFGSAPVEQIHIDDETLRLLGSTRNLWPATGEAIDRLAQQRDFVIVEVTAPDELVRIEKLGKKIRVQVIDREQQIDISVPLATVRAMTTSLQQLSERLQEG